MAAAYWSAFPLNRLRISMKRSLIPIHWRRSRAPCSAIVRLEAASACAVCFPSTSFTCDSVSVGESFRRALFCGRPCRKPGRFVRPVPAQQRARPDQRSLVGACLTASGYAGGSAASERPRTTTGSPVCPCADGQVCFVLRKAAVRRRPSVSISATGGAVGYYDRRDVYRFRNDFVPDDGFLRRDRHCGGRCRWVFRRANSAFRFRDGRRRLPAAAVAFRKVFSVYRVRSLLRSRAFCPFPSTFRQFAGLLSISSINFRISVCTVL